MLEIEVWVCWFGLGIERVKDSGGGWREGEVGSSVPSYVAAGQPPASKL